MAKNWTAPVAVVEQFFSDEYISVCLTCDAYDKFIPKDQPQWGYDEIVLNNKIEYLHSLNNTLIDSNAPCGKSFRVEAPQSATGYHINYFPGTNTVENRQPATIYVWQANGVWHATNGDAQTSNKS